MALSHAKRFNVEINSSGPNSIVYQNQLENLRDDTLQQEFVSDSDLFFENFFFLLLYFEFLFIHFIGKFQGTYTRACTASKVVDARLRLPVWYIYLLRAMKNRYVHFYVFINLSLW